MKSFLMLVPSLLILAACAPDHYSAFDRQETVARFQSRFNANHPDHPLSRELVEMGMQYGIWRGWDMNSQAGMARLEEDLKKVAEPSAAPTRWLFRGTFHVTGLTNSFTETVYGIAILSQATEELSIISDSEKAGIHFKGFARNGRLSGKIDIAAGAVVCKAKAEGSLVPNRISLDAQGENATEMVRGSFNFLR